MRIMIKGRMYPSSKVWIDGVYMGRIISKGNGMWQMNSDGPLCSSRMGAIKQYAKKLGECSYEK